MWLYLISVLGAFIALLSVVGACFALLILLSRFAFWASRPALYECGSPAELEGYIRSWGRWLDDRGRIVVRHPPSGVEIEFRKRRYRSRPDVLLFRYRNDQAGRKYFACVKSAFDSAGISYDLELTPKLHRPRAVVVALDPRDVFTPIGASRLVMVAFGSEDDRPVAGLQVFCEGRMRREIEEPTVDLIAYQQARRAGFRFGYRIGRLLRPYIYPGGPESPR
jgi:hypothetical protein